MPKAMTVHSNIQCHGCGEPLGEDPHRHAIGQEVELPNGLVIYYVYHRRCAPRELIWEELRVMWRLN